MARSILTLWLLGWACAFHAQAQQRVSVPSLDTQQGSSVLLAGYWFLADYPGPRPAVLLLHGCNGVQAANGKLSLRLRDYVTWLNDEGWHALVLDSYSVRGLSETCTHRAGSRVITLTRRRHDALGALQWLAAQPGVDPARLALLGWSSGGSVVLSATNATVPEVKDFAIVPRAAAAFYPGCEVSAQRGYEADAPLLMLLGERDDWTSPQQCRSLVDSAVGGEPVRQVTYHGAGHGFDAVMPAHRRDDPAGEKPIAARPRAGSARAVHAASRDRLLSFFHQYLDE